jgi:hypothetical protein
MKKYIVLPYDFYIKLKNKYDEGDSDLKKTEQNMDDIIMSSTIHDSEKALKYQHALHDLLKKNADLRKPLEIEIKEKGLSEGENEYDVKKKIEKDQISEDVDQISHILTNILPKTRVQQGLALYDFLRGEKSLNWNAEGQVSIENTNIPNLNIIDLIVELSRNKTTTNLKNWGTIKEHLRKINFPTSLIANEHRVKDILTHPTTPKTISLPIRHRVATKYRDKPYITRSPKTLRWSKY